MKDLLVTTTLASAVGSGLMSGLFFTFSNFVMKALVKLPPTQGAVAMQNVNVTIINPWFMLMFLGTALTSLITIVLAIRDWGTSAAALAFSGGVLYLVGCIAITMSCNVPLNDRLAARTDSDAPALTEEWRNYVQRWLPWNHVRTISTLAASITFVLAIRTLS
ncbi:MAG: anthrone oxygenase family protein [Verrucomicrobiota bacterium]